MQQHDEESVLVFTTPGMAQARVIAKLANTEEVATMTAVIVDLANKAKQTNSRKEMKMILHSQIAMLNSLAAYFMTRAVTFYENPEVLQSLPQMAGELANLSLRCQGEMRGCLKLLQELEGLPEAPTGRIKGQAKRQRINSIEVLEQIPQEPGGVIAHEQAEKSGVENQAISSNPSLETVGAYAGCNHG